MALTDKLTAVADAIRAKTGKAEEMTLDQMPDEIASIQSGGSGGLSAVPACFVEIKSPSGVEYYYNHEQLPEIPLDVEYPYLLIRQSETAISLWTCKNKMYFEITESGRKQITIPDAAVRRTLDTTANAWVVDGVYTSSSSSTWFGVDGGGNWAVWWSNYDIPNGSVDATEIYFPASEPKEEKPADATHFHYNGLKLPKIPADVATEEYPYVTVLRYKADDGTGTWIYCSTVQPYCESSDSIRFSKGRRRCSYNAVTDAWNDANTSTSSTYCAFTKWTVIWSNQDIPNGSADATEIYFYGTVAVPDPIE